MGIGPGPEAAHAVGDLGGSTGSSPHNISEFVIFRGKNFPSYIFKNIVFILRYGPAYLNGKEVTRMIYPGFAAYHFSRSSASSRIYRKTAPPKFLLLMGIPNHLRFSLSFKEMRFPDSLWETIGDQEESRSCANFNGTGNKSILMINPIRSPGFFPLLILVVLIPGSCAFTLSDTSVSPLGYQSAGTPVTVTAVIEFPRTGDSTETFPSARDLFMTTGLARARWEPVLILDERETRMPEESGNTLKIAGTYLSYPATQALKVRLTLTGSMPADASSSKDFLRVQDIDAQDNVISTASIAMPEVPFVTPTVSTPPSPTRVPTKRVLPTPLATATTTQESPAGILSGIIATGVLIVMRRR
jgi:hypothetical protein